MDCPVLIKASSIISFAGFDPSGGAGILADCRTFEQFGFHGKGIITALTVQGTKKVYKTVGIPVDVILDSAMALSKEGSVSAIKIGMLFNEATVNSVNKALDLFNSIPVVIDPVICASDQTALIDDLGFIAMKQKLFPKADVITPNVPEAEKLSGIKIDNEKSALKAAFILLELGPKSVVIKGGHLKNEPVDFLATPTLTRKFYGKRIEGPSVHGTGCMFSSALTAMLAKGESLENSILAAKEYVAKKIEKHLN